jgi:predicted secreted protein
MATFRGQDGSMKFATNAVAKLKSWALNSSVDILEDTGMGDPWKTNQPGVAEWSGQGEAFLDYGDTAQKAIIDKIMAATPPTGTSAMEFQVSATGPKKFTGNAIVTSIQITSQIGNIVTVSFSFTGSGALVPAWT